MALPGLPGLSLPGIGTQISSTPVAASLSADNAPSTHTETLAPQTEWRFEASFDQPYGIRLLSGTAELFGVELAVNQVYNLTGQKGAVLSWQGCQLEVSGDADSEYAAQETEYAIEWLNVHGMLETVRDDPQKDGPRVLVVGPDHSGKSSLVRSLTAWAVTSQRAPIVVNLDPREGILAPPSSLTAVTIASQVDVESGYGISGISGATATPMKSPLIYQYSFSSPLDKPDYYKAVLTRMALSATNKLEEDTDTKQSGILIDTPGSLNDARSNYEMIMHIVSEFSISCVLAMGSERLYNDLTKRLATGRSGEEAITVLRVGKPGGAVECDAAFSKSARIRQLRQYFFGTTKEQLNPHSHSVNFSELTIYKVRTDAEVTAASVRDDDDDDIPYANPPSTTPKVPGSFEKVTPSAAMTAALIAIKFCSSNSDENAIRDSAVMGYLYTAEVDETKKKVRFLAPHPQRWGDRALVWGQWPEPVPDLVT